jgi:hypothetical protein
LTLPGVPLSDLLGGVVLVTMPRDSAKVPVAAAQAAADQTAKIYRAGPPYSFVVLAHLQGRRPDGTFEGAPGTLQWVFVDVSPHAFWNPPQGPGPYEGPGTPPPNWNSQPPYRYPAHYAFISVDATTGVVDGSTAT